MSEPESVWPTAAVMTLITIVMAFTFHQCARPDTATGPTPDERTSP